MRPHVQACMYCMYVYIDCTHIGSRAGSLNKKTMVR